MRITPEIVRCWRSQFQIHSSSPVKSGLSSSLVWRLSTSAGEVCLKAWPASHFSPERLEYVQKHVDLARSVGISCIPHGYRTDHGEVCLVYGSYLWQTSQWMQGMPDISGNVSLERRKSAARVLAELHHCWSQQSAITSEAPGVRDRLTLLERAIRDWSALAAAAASTEGQVGELARRTIEYGKKSANRLAAECKKILRPKLLHFAIRDIHCEHVLYAQDCVTGVIDFGAARVDDPILDLVRLLGSQSPIDPEARYQTLQFYFAEREKRLGESSSAFNLLTTSVRSSSHFEDFCVLDETSTLLSALQWFRWLVIEHKRFDIPEDKLLNRWQQLVQRLDVNQW